MHKEKRRNKKVIGCGCLIIVCIIVITLFIIPLSLSLPRVYHSFGDEEKDTIHRMFNITIDDSVTPVKMKLGRGPGGHHDELWLKDIDDPEKFMENCYDGPYTVIEDKRDLIEFGAETISSLYDYNNSLTAGRSYIMYTREYEDGYTPDRYYYVIAFYKDGDSFKAKVVDEDR